MDCKDRIETSILYLLAPKIEYIFFVIIHPKMKNNKGKHKGKNAMRTAEETVKLTYFSSKRRLQYDFYRQLFL